MKRRLPYVKALCIYAVVKLFLCIQPTQANPEGIHPLQFNRLTAFEDLPSEEVTQVIQDSKGYIWIATHSGLCRYDGYRIRTYKDNLFMPGLLTNNRIKCLAEDHFHNLWIGTDNGLNVMDMVTGKIRQVSDTRFEGMPVATICVTRDNNVWVAMDNALFRYTSERDTSRMYDKTKSGKPLFAVKTILEDSKGRLWFGTWGNGLFRYDPQSDDMISYPVLNERNSVHVLFEDSEQNIWIGSWAQGLYKLKNPESPEMVSWEFFGYDEKNEKSLSDDVIYSITEDVGSRTLWVGTRNGLSILDMTNPQKGFTNYLPHKEGYELPYNELNSLKRDRSGMMWLGMLGGGVFSVNLKQPSFVKNKLESLRQTVFSNSVRSLFVDSDHTLWIGVGSLGLAIQERNASEPVFYTDYPGFTRDVNLHTVNTMLERKEKRELWFAIAGNGLFVYDKESVSHPLRHITIDNAAWLPDNYTMSLLEDSKNNIWIGGRSGLAVVRPDGNGVNLKLNHTYNSIIETEEGDIWLGTDYGIGRLPGKFSENIAKDIKWYTTNKESLPYNRIQCLFEDSRGNIWAGSDGGGLNLYSPEKDIFISVNNKYNIMADGIYTIEEDSFGNLWLGTSSAGLIKLSVSEDTHFALTRTYTTSDGLVDNYFVKNASCKAPDGKLYFGGHNGFNSFYPDNLRDEEIISPVDITDISVFNLSLIDMEPAVREKISSSAPGFTDKIVLNYDQNHFSIEFSVLSFTNPTRNQYIYRLDGYDTGWQYTDASNRSAHYNNLKSGTYLFRLRGASENGVWAQEERLLQVVILPPFWETGWAYTCYGILLLLTCILLYRMLRKRIQRKQFRQIELLEQKKSEEINHAKLQFFTNITHEFLTPLTILSASLDELKISLPSNHTSYQVMSDNINRLFRLIQQILEFRKAETGNLKLKVAEGDIISFIRKEIDAFRPLMKKKKMECIFLAEPEVLSGYFDKDKLDKILYNLLSNASKYNRESGVILVRVSYDNHSDKFTFSVEDNGEGIPPEAINSLFKRFYEGDYRRYNTVGTGIGLSLTKDLVTLHRGTIEVESEPGKGTSFIVSIPIKREAYQPDQIESPYSHDLFDETATGIDESIPDEITIEEKEYTLLIVEDNESLLTLIVKLLSRDYNVFTAKHGKEAVEIIEKENIDLIVSDIMMPEMDGVELCRYVKNNFEVSHIPVLLLTAKTSEEDRILSYESGADGYITKPFNLSLLYVRIQNLLKKRQREAKEFKKQLVFEVQEMNYTSLDEEFLEKAIQCVQNHLSDADFDQPQFIDEMGTSKSTLYKKLKTLTGLNTSAFIRNIRLKAACRIMEEKGAAMRVSELAYAVGFNDPKYFSACFKKEFGMLPTDYMERYQIPNNG